MHREHTYNRNCRSKQGFTLAETLFAILILGLGMFGIGAVLAVSVTQQQDALTRNENRWNNKNKESLLEGILGRQLEGRGIDSLPTDTWLLVPSINNDWGLSFDLLDGNSASSSIHLPSESVLTSVPDGISLLANPPVETGTDSGIFEPEDTGALIPSSLNDLDVQKFAHDSVSPSTIEIAVECRSQSVNNGLTPVRILFRTHPQNITLFDGTLAYTLYPKNTDPMDAVSLPNIVVNCQLQEGASEPAGIDSLDFSRLASYLASRGHGASDTSWWVSKIRVEYYEYFRAFSTAASVSDRVVFVPDEEFAGGSRASSAFSVVFRRNLNNTQQMAVFRYNIELLNSPSLVDARYGFVPPESLEIIDKTTGVIREADVDLYYDGDVGRYYIVSNSAADAWSIRAGQLFLLESASDVPAGEPVLDIPIRIVNVREIADGTSRAYIDRSPLTSLSLKNLEENATTLGMDGAFESLTVIGVADIVQDAVSPVQWKLTPVSIDIW